jgi:hypothetical protein
MKSEWTSKVCESGIPATPHQAVVISPTGKKHWVGNYATRRRAELEGEGEAKQRNR